MMVSNGSSGVRGGGVLVLAVRFPFLRRSDQGREVGQIPGCPVPEVHHAVPHRTRECLIQTPLIRGVSPHFGVGFYFSV